MPRDDMAAMLSPGTFGYGGAWGTQAWIDPVKGVASVRKAALRNARWPVSSGEEHDQGNSGSGRGRQL
jgi:hypothetical protein